MSQSHNRYLIILILGARVLERPIRKLFAKLPQNAKLAKVEHWLLLALDCIRQIGIIGSLVRTTQIQLIRQRPSGSCLIG